MKFILFGAGDVGIRALRVIGEEFVECFADNNKSGNVLCSKTIISFEEMLQKKEEFVIVITSTKYVNELEQQLLDAGVREYLIFNRRYYPSMNKYLPKYNYLYNTQYMNYTDILLNYNIGMYRNVVIVGTNECLKNLLFEIAILSDLGCVKAVISDDGTEKYGFPNIKLEEIESETDCIIINVPRKESDIRESEKLIGKNVIDIYDIDKFIFYNIHPELVKYKDIHKNKRIFLVGNGPSVRIEDLELLKKNNEICFGMNRIYKVFSETTWRPNYICMTDSRVIISSEKDLELIIKDSRLILGDRYFYSKHRLDDKIDYVHLKSEYYAPNFPGFSEDITQGVFWGYTVTYDIALQFAAYMGASEIYLIGIDHNNIGAVTDTRNHFIKDYFEPEEEETYKGVVANFDAMTIAYKKAKKYASENGFAIYNATRGGKLEVFERVDFESLF